MANNDHRNDDSQLAPPAQTGSRQQTV